jgi:exopolysaccharide biosynthesis protein
MSRARTAAGVAIVIASLTMLVAFIPSPGVGSAAGRKPKPPPVTTTVRKLAPGVKLTKVVDRRTPQRTYILAVDPRMASIDVVLADDQIPGLERTSSMARRTHAVAAVNGDFGFSSGKLVHPMAIDGQLVQSSLNLGASFAMSADGGFRIGAPQVSASVVQAGTGETWPINAWNAGRPNVGDLDAYTSLGGAAFGPPRNSCWASLLPVGDPVPGARGVVRDYTVDRATCTTAPADAGSGVVLAALPGTDEATTLRTLTPGETMSLAWSLGWPGVTEAIGGDPVLVRSGKAALGACTSSLCRRNPRTAVAIRRDGIILLVVADGRQKGSVGMSLSELTRFLIKRGAVDAMNLDGGGSSVMVAKGKVVSRPVGMHERSVSSAIVVTRP